ncbi:ATP-binding cassette domain-containing protein [Rhodococcus triatomae]|uniref:D-methionine transport system ATP-binding protein n=1 Tax=Rhodococcus triatomae TaxID=300028 RepID=A0A1G8B4F0_9NOCA|nr:ATP-binding cassette domain-containing protein [Rhodococcus triatomae]QNG17585.1 ATP-binding cassette domain-containing protein [Rhodococcus triatomae]QNG22747.1 ATP-binding cassette domain-containing protein [Rhodococcus triatomae]SDH28067.1 D-methionine transport system ATP-binding protein [Rhodococcus triatomae]
MPFSIQQVTKEYADGDSVLTALDSVSLDIEDGEVFGIIGRSGAGKSTLLRCLNLLETPTSGRILLGDIELTSLTPAELRTARRRIGVVFQHFNLLHSRTVEANISFPLEVAGYPRNQRRERIDELVELVGLGHRRRAYPSQLSGGQKQRVGIARALAAGPDVLLCDEATSALDSETTTQILDLLADLNRRLGVTVVLITHDLGVVRRICHRAALLADGRVADVGTLTDLVADPDSPLGAALLPSGPPPADSRGIPALLTFVDSLASSPVLTDVARDLDLDVTIRSGGVDDIGKHQVGRLRVEFDSRGDDPESSGGTDTELRTRISRYLTGRGVQVSFT